MTVVVAVDVVGWPGKMGSYPWPVFLFWIAEVDDRCHGEVKVKKNEKNGFLSGRSYTT